MSGSFLPSPWFSTNHSLLGSQEPALLCNQVEYVVGTLAMPPAPRWGGNQNGSPPGLSLPFESQINSPPSDLPAEHALTRSSPTMSSNPRPQNSRSQYSSPAVPPRDRFFHPAQPVPRSFHSIGSSIKNLPRPSPSHRAARAQILARTAAHSKSRRLPGRSHTPKSRSRCCRPYKNASGRDSTPSCSKFRCLFATRSFFRPHPAAAARRQSRQIQSPNHPRRYCFASSPPTATREDRSAHHSAAPPARHRT